MDEREKQLKPRRICFTGHRPEKLKRSKQDIIKDLESQIRRAIADGFNVFITGMSRGVDLWAAKIVLKIRDSGENVKLIINSQNCNRLVIAVLEAKSTFFFGFPST